MHRHYVPVQEKSSHHHRKLRDILGHPSTGKHAETFHERSTTMLANHLQFLKKRGNIYFERVNYGHDKEGAALLATVVRGVTIPDFEFSFCWGREIVERYGIDAAVIAAYVKQEVRHVGCFMVSTQTGEIVPARKITR